MNTYRMTVRVEKTYSATDTQTFDIEAIDEDSAKKIAESKADADCQINSWDIECNETDTIVESCEFLKGDVPPQDAVTPRCEKTKDMFGE